MEMIRDEICDQIILSAKRIAQQKSAGKITVRDILNDLQLTNRVFYNRFHNIDEVLGILYEETVSKVRESLSTPWTGEGDFGEHILQVASGTLILTYESRQYMGAYVFEADSVNQANFEWWSQEIRKLIGIGKEIGYLKADLDDEAITYSIWCYIRGFNADALARNLPREEAVRLFRYGFGFLLEGLKKN